MMSGNGTPNAKIATKAANAIRYMGTVFIARLAILSRASMTTARTAALMPKNRAWTSATSWNPA